MKKYGHVRAGTIGHRQVWQANAVEVGDDHRNGKFPASNSWCCRNVQSPLPSKTDTSSPELFGNDKVGYRVGVQIANGYVDWEATGFEPLLRLKGPVA